MTPLIAGKDSENTRSNQAIVAKMISLLVNEVFSVLSELKY
jgi:hypothetical protein